VPLFHSVNDSKVDLIDVVEEEDKWRTLVICDNELPDPTKYMNSF
jgi:hypothetical protein